MADCGIRDDAELPDDASFSRHWDEYRQCSSIALEGDHRQAEAGLKELLSRATDVKLVGHIQNDLGVLAAFAGRNEDARRAFAAASEIRPEWYVPHANLRRMTEGEYDSDASKLNDNSVSKRTRIAVVSLLFNWPSTGGGTVHTAELARFLSRAGYEVLHVVVCYSGWQIGGINEEVDWPVQRIEFGDATWSVESIKKEVRTAVDRFAPDSVVVTDSWNSKPILAEALKGYRFFLRIAAQECLCPLNNVRLLFDQGRFCSCPKHQLATPSDCCQCVYKNGKFSGRLHQLEREFVEYGSREYDQSLRWAFANAEAVLVVNPLIGAMIAPYAKKVCVVPSGFDSKRFPKPEQTKRRRIERTRLQILFAGLVHEPMKGFDVIQEACRRLWNRRHDFELVATADPLGQMNPFTRYIGWQSQGALPAVMREADILVFPTIAEEALGRTAVEAMGAGLPVVASRIGGLQFTVVDGATGFLFESGDVEDLCEKLERLLDDPDLRERMGCAGRRVFEDHFTWESILPRHYLPLFGAPIQTPTGHVAHSI